MNKKNPNPILIGALLAACSPANQGGGGLGYDAGIDVLTADSGAADITQILLDEDTEKIIRTEEEGVQVIERELQDLGYIVEVNNGSWRINLQNPKTGSYTIVLQPDIRFWRKENDPYSYLEFLSDKDIPSGVESDTPFYRELVPDTEDNLRQYVQEL